MKMWVHLWVVLVPLFAGFVLGSFQDEILDGFRHGGVWEPNAGEIERAWKRMEEDPVFAGSRVAFSNTGKVTFAVEEWSRPVCLEFVGGLLENVSVGDCVGHAWVYVTSEDEIVSYLNSLKACAPVDWNG